MSFFSNGFATMVNNRRNKVVKSNDKQVHSGNESDGTGSKDEGRWDMLTDVYGRLYMQHSVAGEWSFIYGSSGIVSPFAAVHPSPMVYPWGAVFTPSPTPVAMINTSPVVYPTGAAVYTPSPVYHVRTTKKNEEGRKRGEGKKEGEGEKEGEGKKEEEGKKEDEGKKKEAGNGKGWWETMYDEEGVRYWEHTVSKKKTYKDPYF